METVLVEAWLDGTESVPVIDEASVSVVRQHVREVAAGSLPLEALEALVTAASELAHNQRRHATGGRVAARRLVRGGVAGVEVIAADSGLGLADPTGALRGKLEPKESLGVGVQAARRLSHEIDFDVRGREGTCIRARVFAEPIARRREIGIIGRPIEGERASGDHAAFMRRDDRLWVTVVDGLGHGEPAREASDRAISTFLSSRTDSPQAVVEDCHRLLAGTRGAVMAVVCIDEATDDLEACLVGNVEAGVFGAGVARRFAGGSFVLGARQPLRKLHADRATLDRREAVVLFSDGIVRRHRIEDEPALLHEHPIVIAQFILEQFAREHDDAIVLVAR
jgi:anti-sigma regulatory factor (Ser/Thr protein kinase)